MPILVENNITSLADVRVEIQLIHHLAKVPTRKRLTDVGYDIYSIQDVHLDPGRTTIVETGIRVATPPGYYYTIEGRSSLWKIGIVPNRGIIDATFCGDLVVGLVNFAEKPYHVRVGDRIAQLIFHRQIDVQFHQITEFGPDYNQRGTDAFGSSGR